MYEPPAGVHATPTSAVAPTASTDPVELLALYTKGKERADRLQDELTVTENSWGKWQDDIERTKLIDLSSMESLDLVRQQSHAP